jgi:hypothetical protein
MSMLFSREYFFEKDFLTADSADTADKRSVSVETLRAIREICGKNALVGSSVAAAPCQEICG